MKKRIAAVILSMVLGAGMLAGCGQKNTTDAGASSTTEVSADAEKADSAATDNKEEDADANVLEDGTYSVNVELSGGTGRATVDSPATVTVTDGQATATIVWSSTHYDYMIVGGEKYLNENEGGNSTFTFPIDGVPCEMDVVGDTTAMSTPHEIDYTLTFSFPTEVSFNDLNSEGRMNLSYADQFSVEQYGAYKLVTIVDGGRFLLVPKGASVPTDVPSNIVVLQQPLNDVYLVSSAVMDLVSKAGALSHISFTGTKEKDWYVQEAADAMKAGTLTYAGKYSAPDYELLLSNNCQFAIENTMISHTPEVKEQLEKFGVPVLTDHSSYEKNPLGRTEWVKLYGLLTGHEKEAEEAFAAENEAFASIGEEEETGKTVAFFYITTNGEVNVRKSADYLPKMIELAGGKYIFDKLGDEDDVASTMSMQMEEFYAGAKDADYIIYNSTIDGGMQTLSDLTGKSPMLEKFKAVQDGNVYCTTKNLYQSTMELGTITSDIHKMLIGDDADLTYLYKLE